MKKITAILLVLTFVIAFAGCAANDNPTQNEQQATPIISAEPAETQQDTVPEMTPEATENTTEPSAESNTLIAYFSYGNNVQTPYGVDATTSASIIVDGTDRYGTTEYVANMIQTITGGDAFSIITQDAYPTDFDAVIDQNHEEMASDYLPPLVDGDVALEQYDTVFIGYPIWAGTIPQAIVSFLSQNDLSGKTVIPFCTHDGFGSGNSYDTIASLSPQATVLDGIAIEAVDVPDAQGTISEWLGGLGLGTEAEVAETSNTELPISISIGDTVLEGVMYDTLLAQEITSHFPLTVSMGGFGGREFYGGIDFTPENTGEGQLNFTDGDITYCKQNNTLAIFYAQTDNPDLTMEVTPIGRVTSDLSVFDTLHGRVDITFSLTE